MRKKFIKLPSKSEKEKDEREFREGVDRMNKYLDANRDRIRQQVMEGVSADGVLAGPTKK